jgi:Arc/MetJ-type ribon-helix-helix transcriptional regulator
MVEIDIPQEFLEKIEKYVKEGRFKNKDDFFQQAVNLLLYAEDRKEEFQKIIKEGKQS